MTQAQWLLLALKVTLPAATISLLAWVAVYSRLTRWQWARNPVGRSLVYLALLSAASMQILALSLFAHFSLVEGEVAGWCYVAIIGLTVPAMIWRIVVWLRLHRADRLPSAVDAEVAALKTENAALRKRLGET